MPKHLEIVFKPTLQCNAACAYCNVIPTASFANISLVERLFLQLSDFMRQNENCSVSMLWHGGEPTLLGETFYRQALELDRRLFDSGPSHVMQSNLTLLTEPLADLLSEFLTGGGIGTSLDPFEDYRRLRNGDSYFDRWYDGFERATSRGLRVGMVYVVHARSLGQAKKIYHFFKNLGLDSLTIIPLEEPAGPFDEPRLAARAWGEFLAEMFRAWKQDGCVLPVEPFASWEKLEAGEGADAPSYTDCLNCCEPTLAVSPDGEVYPCVRLLDSATGRIGNILTESLDEIIADPAASWRTMRRDLIRQGDCGLCRWWKYCRGGCAAASGIRDKTVWCEGHKLFFEVTHAEFDHRECSCAADREH
jgi:uncharacterized protein